MTPDSVAVMIMIATFVIVIAILSLQWDQKRQYLADVKRRYVPGTVQCAPLSAYWYGSEPRKTYTSTNPSWGALVMVDNQLIFVERRSPRREYVLDFRAIHWIGIRQIIVQSGKNTVRKNALILHCEDIDPITRLLRWSTAAFVVEQNQDHLANLLSQYTGLPLHHQGSQREDYGPDLATRLYQDIYGQWHPTDFRDDLPDDWQTLKGSLYLAPDRLLYNGASGILFSQIQQVEVYEKGTLLHEINPYSTDLLRIEYQDGGGQVQVIGFSVHRADQWGEAIRERGGVPLRVHQGRKKKGA